LTPLISIPTALTNHPICFEQSSSFARRQKAAIRNKTSLLGGTYCPAADALNELQAWFSENLEEPTSFGRDRLRLGICWLKTASTEHISRIWEMVRILEHNCIDVKKIRTDKPAT